MVKQTCGGELLVGEGLVCDYCGWLNEMFLWGRWNKLLIKKIT